jgi:anti-sigma regulatory factor (Ser/Thr protein kinase)
VEALLIDDWTRGLTTVPTRDVASVSAARQKVREEGARLGLGEEVIGALAIIVSELANNQLAHAAHGHVAVHPIARAGIMGLEIVAADAGRGIADPTRAFEGAPRSAGSLGVGLSGVRSLSDELDLDVRLGEGTCVRARKFAAAVPREREVAILGRPCEGERVSGDQAGFERLDGALTVFVVDGLGHGPEAREAADRAVLALRQAPGAGGAEVLRRVDAALSRSRGAVMTVASLDEAAERLDFAAVGNVMTQVVRFRGTRMFTGSSFVLGMTQAPPRKVASEQIPVARGEVLLMWSDGISSRATIDARRDLIHASAITIAQHLLESAGRLNDDATVLVAR